MVLVDLDVPALSWPEAAEGFEVKIVVGSGQSALPAGAVQTRGDTGTSSYTGAAPPPGPAHRYIFTVHALKMDSLPLDEHASGAMVGFMVHMNSLAKASLTVHYGA